MQRSGDRWNFLPLFHNMFHCDVNSVTLFLPHSTGIVAIPTKERKKALQHSPYKNFSNKIIISRWNSLAKKKKKFKVLGNDKKVSDRNLSAHLDIDIMFSELRLYISSAFLAPYKSPFLDVRYVSSVWCTGFIQLLWQPLDQSATLPFERDR